MHYRHTFQVDEPQAVVREFHRHPSALVGITPPPVFIRLDNAPDPLQDGDEMAFTTWIGPLPIRWRSRIESVDATGFTDRQVSGPFREWVHRHEFLPLGDSLTLVRDDIEFSLRPHPVWGMVGLSMAAGLPVLFAYRTWKTRRLLGRS
jgi:ligand-binding SRPBCC domain-containing protein